MLSAEEINKVFSWQPYRAGWPVGPKRREITECEPFTTLLWLLEIDAEFEVYQTQDGGMSNYLEFICHPAGVTNGNAVMLMVSLCAPVAAYGQTTFSTEANAFGYGFITAEQVGVITDTSLKPIESSIRDILLKANIEAIDAAFASILLAEDISASIQEQNLNQGKQNLHGLFQWND